MTNPQTPLLDTVREPADLRALKPGQLRQLADELRAEVISAVGVTGGHLGSGLGVVELTTAIHYVFDTPSDRLVWDVGHQCYPHKILTGRRDRIRTLQDGRRPVGLHQAVGERVRPVRGGALVHLDLRRAGLRHRQPAGRSAGQGDRGDRRRRHVGGHGV